MKKKIENNIAEIIITAIFITLIASSCGSSYQCPSYACDDDQSRPNLVFVNNKIKSKMETMYIILIVLASYTFGFMSGIIRERNNENK